MTMYRAHIAAARFARIAGRTRNASWHLHHAMIERALILGLIPHR